MVAINYSWRLSTLSPRVIAGLAGAAGAASIVMMPGARLDSLIGGSGISALITAAAPPVGMTGRTLLALTIGMAIAMAGYVAGGRLRDQATVTRRRAPRSLAPADVPVLRRADAHPDAPSRRPIRASEDLGPPLPIAAPPLAPQNYEQPLPVDLDLPLAAFDPGAVPVTPAEPARPVAPLAVRRALIDPGERFETFELTPVTRSARPAPVSEQSSIGALLDRLERSAQRAGGRVDVERTLGMLRGLATG